jgi:K+-sensing histidine kinase KdpD
MALRKELAQESRERLERVVASSVRMQRMVEQLMNLAEAQRPDGVAIERGEARDLVPLVHKVVREVGNTSPSRSLTLFAIACSARVDVEQFEQVVWSLLSYVASHVEPRSGIHVEVRPADGVAKISIESSGLFVDGAFLPHLFDSFHLETQPEIGMDGLTLGLYLAKRIVTAHGGKVEARSSEETGAKLEAMLPLA